MNTDKRIKVLERQYEADPWDTLVIRELVALYKRTGWTFEGRTIEQWIGCLSTEDSDELEEACEVLSELGPIAYEAIPVLIELLGSEEWLHRDLAMSGLRCMGFLAVPELMEALDRDDEISRRVAEVLGEMGSLATPSLIEVVNSGSDKARHGAAIALCESDEREPEVLDAFEILLDDDRLEVRYLAMRGISRFGPHAQHLRAKLLPFLESDGPERRASASCLVYLCVTDERLIESLMSDLESEEEGVLVGALDCLAQMGQAASSAALSVSKVLETRQSADIVRRALFALGRVGDAELAPVLIGHLSSDDYDVLWGALEGLKSLGASAKSAVPRLLEFLEVDSEHGLQEQVLEALGSMGREGREAIPGVLELSTTTDDQELRLLVAKTLLELGAVEESRGLFEEYLKSEDGQARYVVLCCLREHREAVGGLETLLKSITEDDPDQMVRLAASDLLSTLELS